MIPITQSRMSDTERALPVFYSVIEIYLLGEWLAFTLLRGQYLKMKFASIIQNAMEWFSFLYALTIQVSTLNLTLEQRWLCIRMSSVIVICSGSYNWIMACGDL